ERSDRRIVDLDDVAARRVMRVGEDVADAEGAADRHLGGDQDPLDLLRRVLAAPGGDDRVQLLAVASAIGERRVARVLDEIRATYRSREPREQAVAGGDDRNEVPVTGLPVVERRRILQSIAFSLP